MENRTLKCPHGRAIDCECKECDRQNLKELKKRENEAHDLFVLTADLLQRQIEIRTTAKMGSIPTPEELDEAERRKK